MNQLVNALDIQSNLTQTENGDLAHKSSLNACVDYFFSVSQLRNADDHILFDTFMKAYNESPDVAVRILLWSRDVRGGAGERNTFRRLINKMATTVSLREIAQRILVRIPDIGRWDDLLSFLDTKLDKEAAMLIQLGLRDPNVSGLVAKWMPRKGPQAAKLRTLLKMSPKQYRKTLVGLTNVVETKMCAKQWSEIDYNVLPSRAAALNQQAFMRHDQDRYEQYIESLQKGEAKINAEAIFPHDVIKAALNGNAEVATQQWNSMPNWVPEDVNFLVMSDVSLSMITKVSGSSTAMDVSVALGLYLAERCPGAFKDRIMTFSTNPTFHIDDSSLNIDVRARLLRDADWGGSTNLDAAMKLLLNTAIEHNVSKEDMPTHLIILSDMQFNQFGNKPVGPRVKQMFEDSSYEMPTIIWWNLHGGQAGRVPTVPTLADDTGMIMVSGFSPAMMKSVSSLEFPTPEVAMLQTVCIDRYDF